MDAERMSGDSVTQKKEGLWETVKTVLYAVLIAVGIRTVAYEPFHIPSGSMIPSLLIGDFLFVSKFSYGYSKHSLPFSLPLLNGRILASMPERGDVVVFKTPTDNSTDFIKRVIGLPGDRIQFREGRLYINGEVVQRQHEGDFLYRKAPFGQVVQAKQYIETLPGGRRHRIIEETDTNPGSDNTGVFEVPPGHFFMVGDNRDDSSDSRFQLGFVPLENLVGRAEFLFFSVDGSFWRVWEWPWTLRGSRFFMGVN